MGLSTQDGLPIAQGYPWSFPIQTEAALFPAGSTFKAQVRAKPASASVLAEATTGNGGITRVSDTQVTLYFDGATTAGFPLGTVWIDMVRTDLAPNTHLGFWLEVPVLQPVTR
jgi:hypothetical protein